MKEEGALRVTDTRTAKEYRIPIEENSVRAAAFAKISVDSNEGLRLYDPAYTNTAVVRSKICFIDGDKGILEYRGYPIEELAEKSTFLEVAYLLVYGELPSKVAARRTEGSQVR